MLYWRKDYFETLKDVASRARGVPGWADYAAFCEEFERGLRDVAFATLDRFITSIEDAPFANRRQFVSWILQEAEGRTGRHMLMPHPLYIRVIEPTLLEWTLSEPDCYEPHLWLGGHDHLSRALELAPHSELVTRKLIAAILSRVGFATHELPAGYLGVVTEDLDALSRAETLLQNLSDRDERAQLAAEILGERELIQRYLRSR